ASLFLELHGRAVHAVALPGRRGPVLEHMAEVAAALVAVHFDARHAVAPVGRRADGAFDRREKARPPGAAVVFRFRQKERLTAPGAIEPSVALLGVERARAAHFGPVLPQHLVLLGRQGGTPLVVGLLDGKIFFVRHHSILPRSPERTARALSSGDQAAGGGPPSRRRRFGELGRRLGGGQAPAELKKQATIIPMKRSLFALMVLAIAAAPNRAATQAQAPPK